MRDTIIIHCSATRAGQDFTAADIDRWHRARGFRSIGYHFVIRLDGTIEPGRDVSLDGAHCTGWNRRSIGICYVGGLDKEGRPADTRTEAQREALIRLVEDLRLVYPDIRQVIGHRDTSPDRNGDGINPLNAGKKKEEALSMLKKWFPQMENFSGQLKKYKVTINDLLAENEKLEARARASESGKIKDRMERAKLESELHDMQRLVDRIPPDILAELKRQQRQYGKER